VFFVSEDPLYAAISQYDPGNSIDLPDLMAYKDVIEACYRRDTVIPMRYGCFFEEESGVLRFLRNHAPRHQALLKELDGCAEMGLRLVLPGSGLISEGDEVRGTDPGSEGRNPGKAYLEARSLHYAREDRLTDGMDSLAEKWTEAFSGLLVKSKAEKAVSRVPFPASAPGERLLSLFFLVPKGHVDAFLRVFERMKPSGPEKPILTGPWPPYNFVL
jgi:hypothetical protein